ncbi:MAG: hypothetical protein LBQ59_03535 [Candidatus Peribacteria bacterium]|nr:hypothetical protein [Candidatus Peribacteria bacterium]
MLQELEKEICFKTLRHDNIVSLLGQVLKKSVPNTLNINIMTIHTNLPVYKTSYDLLLKTIQLVDTFPKKYKYSI